MARNLIERKAKVNCRDAPSVGAQTSGSYELGKVIEK